MNIYRYNFTCVCPVDGAVIAYALEIRSPAKVMAEDIRRICAKDKAFHEDLADELSALGGEQTLRAVHGGVAIETLRP